MNFTTNFRTWAKSFVAADQLSALTELTKSLTLSNFAHQESIKAIFWTLTNHQPLAYEQAKAIDHIIRQSQIEKIYWNYDDLQLDEPTLQIFSGYLTAFCAKQNLKTSPVQFIRPKNANYLVLLSPRFRSLSLYETELRTFFEKWGMSLPEFKCQPENTAAAKHRAAAVAPTKSKGSSPATPSPQPPTKPITPPPQSASSLNLTPPPALEKKMVTVPQVSMASPHVVNNHNQTPPFSKNWKFTLIGEVLKINTNSYDNKHFVRILVDTGIHAYWITLQPNEVKVSTIPELNSWYRFACEHVLRKSSKKDHETKMIRCSAFELTKQCFPRFDDAPAKRIELHTHTKMSALDGVASVTDYLQLARSFGHSAIAFTDHENIHAFAELDRQIDQFPDLKIIFGCEFNFIHEQNMVISENSDQSFADTEFVVLDVETTGLSLNFSDMIEFAAIIWKKGFPVRETNFLIKSDAKITPQVTELTNITPEEQEKHGIEPAKAARRVFELIGNRPIVAHNARFDVGFINKLLTAHGYEPLKNIVIDTIPLGRCLFPDKKSFRLGKLARYLGVTYNSLQAHRALYDTRVLSKIFTGLVYGLKIETFAKLFQLNKGNVSRLGTIPRHANVLVRNSEGLTNLYRLISLTHTKTLYKQPTLEWSDYQNHSAGLLIGSGCYNGEVFSAAAFGSSAELKTALARYDYIEVQPPDVYQHFVDRGFLTNSEIKQTIQLIIQTAQDLNKIVVATGDVHFLHPKDALYRDIYIFNKQLKGSRHPLFDFADRVKTSPPQFFRTTAEMKEAFRFLNDSDLIDQIVVTNTHLIANQIEKLPAAPTSISIPKLDNGNEELTTKARALLHKKYGAQIDAQIEKRFNQELEKVIKQGYATIYLIAEEVTHQSLKKGYLVGSRGSVGSSFLAYCLDITEVNPLSPHHYCSACSVVEWVDSPATFSGFDLSTKKCKTCDQPMVYDGQTIAFESFLGLDEKSLPDIDLNFSGDFQNEAQKYLTQWMEDKLGPNKVFRAGTISGVAEKTAFGYWRNYQELTECRELSPAELDKLLVKISGVKRTTGQHPGGLMIIPKEIDVHQFTPYHHPSNNVEEDKTTHFDYHALHNRLLKIDLLGHDDPTGLRMLEDLTGKNPKDIPIAEPAVLRIFSDIRTLGISPSQVKKEVTGSLGLPEFGTDFVRRICRDFPVQSFADLVSVSGLSHGTNVWENNARDLMMKKKFKFQETIANRDDVMNFLITKYNVPKKIAYDTMQHVKKGKGIKPETEAELRKFKVESWFIESCQKIKYLFPKAHATAYSIMAYRFAWYKLTYPAEFYATYFTIRCEVFDLPTISAGPAAINAAIDEINKRIRLDPKSVTSKEKNLLPIYLVALEMYARGIQLRFLDLVHSQAERFSVRTEGNNQVIYPAFAVVDRLGKEGAQRIIEERDKKTFTHCEDFAARTKLNKTILDNLDAAGLFRNLPKSLQKNFFS